MYPYVYATAKQRDTRIMLIALHGEALSLTFEGKSEPSSGGRPSKVYVLAKRETLILVSGRHYQHLVQLNVSASRGHMPTTEARSSAILRR